MSKARVISIINLKGGVAKSMTAINMADILCRRFEKRVLLMDNDIQANMTKFYRLYSPETEAGMSILLGGCKPEILHTSTEGIDIVTSNMGLMTATWNLTMSMAPGQHLRYKDFIDEVRGEYDYIIIDNPPTISMNIINALVATDDVIVPVKIDEWSLDGLDIIAEQIEEAKQYNSKIRLAGCLITIYRKTDAQVNGEKWLRENSQYPVFLQKIRYSDKVDDSTFYHQGIAEYSRRSAAAIDYIRFVQEYMSISERRI